jgi:hypothetical protein
MSKTKIETKPLPNALGSADVADAELRRVVTLFMENFRSLHGQLKAAQAAIKELQRR